MSGSFAVLVVAIATSGYILASRCVLNRYQIARQNGHRLYLSSMTFGVYALLPALAVTELASLFFNINKTYVSAALTLGIALTFTEIYNRNPSFSSILRLLKASYSQPIAKTFAELEAVFSEDTARRSKALWSAWQKNDLELICAYALSEFKPIAITLDTQKVYVGMVSDTIEPSDTESYLSILPLYSGYREKETHLFKLNHKYTSLINGLIRQDADVINSSLDYVIAIPLEKIVTLHIFNDNLYQEVSGQSIDSLKPPTSTEPTAY